MNSNYAFCGQIGSGKTHISKAFAALLGARWNSFGNTLRIIAAESGITPTRENLQKLGEKMMATSAEVLCRRTIDAAYPVGADTFVIDGVRHSQALELLRYVARPSTLLCVYIDVSLQVRMQRLRERDSLTEEQIRRFENHSTEMQVNGELRRVADLIIDNSGDITTTLDSLVSNLRRKGLHV